MDVEYIVDSALELGEITPLEQSTIYLIESAYAAIDSKLASKENWGTDFLHNIAQDSFHHAEKDVQYWVALKSLPLMSFAAKCLRERAEYLVQTTLQRDLNVFQGASSVASLKSTQAFSYVTQPEDITETVIRLVLTDGLGSLWQRLTETRPLILAAIQWYQHDAGAAFKKLDVAYQSKRPLWSALTIEACLHDLAKRKARERAENKRPVRGAIKKVCKLFALLREERTLNLFVSGHEVELSHPDSRFKFILRPLGEPGWLLDRTARGHAHTPYDLALLTKDNVFISKLCVYFSDTPVLDQLLALSIFVQSGAELDLLEKANFYGTASGATPPWNEVLLKEYPSLDHKFIKKLGRVHSNFPSKLETILFNEPMFQAAHHWEPYKGRVAAWVSTWFAPAFEGLSVDCPVPILGSYPHP